MPILRTTVNGNEDDSNDFNEDKFVHKISQPKFPRFIVKNFNVTFRVYKYVTQGLKDSQTKWF